MPAKLASTCFETSTSLGPHPFSLIGTYVLAPALAAATFGEISGSHPFFFLAIWSPAISAFLVVVFYSGLSGLRAFLSRLLLWRCSWGWVAFILLFLPLVFVAGSLVKGGAAHGIPGHKG